MGSVQRPVFWLLNNIYQFHLGFVNVLGITRAIQKKKVLSHNCTMEESLCTCSQRHREAIWEATLCMHGHPKWPCLSHQHAHNQSPQSSCPSIKAELESGLPVAHYRYTCGKTHGYDNLRVQVTGDHRSTRIWVHVLGAVSTCLRYCGINFLLSTCVSPGFSLLK